MHQSSSPVLDLTVPLPTSCSALGLLLSPVRGFGTRACRAVTDPSTTAETWEEWACWLQVVRHQLFDCSGYSKGRRCQLGCEVVVHLHPRAVKVSAEVCVHRAAWHLAALQDLLRLSQSSLSFGYRATWAPPPPGRAGTLGEPQHCPPQHPAAGPRAEPSSLHSPSEEQPKHSAAGAPAPNRLWSKMPQETLSGCVLGR